MFALLPVGKELSEYEHETYQEIAEDNNQSQNSFKTEKISLDRTKLVNSRSTFCFLVTSETAHEHLVKSLLNLPKTDL